MAASKVGFSVITCAALLLCFNIYISTKEKTCLAFTEQYFNDVIAYDQNDGEIRRLDCFIAGKMKTKPVFLMIGIPTIYREYNNSSVFYLLDTIKSLLQPLSSEKKHTVQFLILLADREPKKRGYIHNKLTKEFPNQLRDGLINIIAIPDRYYRNLHNLPSTFDDSPERMYWRSKQVLDYAFMFNYAHKLSSYYMQMEDDVTADSRYYDVIREEIGKHNEKRRVKEERTITEGVGKLGGESWMVLEFYKMGFIGRVIPAHYLPLLSRYCQIFYDQIPVDWIYPVLVRQTHATKHMLKSLFTHVGSQSSSLGT